MALELLNGGGGGSNPVYQRVISQAGKYGIDAPVHEDVPGLPVYVHWNAEDITNADANDPLILADPDTEGPGGLVIQKSGLYGLMLAPFYTATGTGIASDDEIKVYIRLSNITVNELYVNPKGFDADAFVSIANVAEKTFGPGYSFIPAEQLTEVIVGLEAGQILRVLVVVEDAAHVQAGSWGLTFLLRALITQ